jgi:hypothetical protein
MVLLMVNQKQRYLNTCGVTYTLGSYEGME